MEKLISVIIPVYNVAPYLPQCLDSVLNQSYRNLEVILVDDGSTDGSGEICDIYASKDSRIVVRHQANSGGPAAKNTALRIASGEYLAFADADDYVEPDAYRSMADMMEMHDVDAVQGNFRNVYTNRSELQGKLFELRVFEVEEYIKEYASDWTCSLLWDKLYKRSLFENIFFEEGHIVDDEFFTYQGMMNAKKIIRVPIVVYNYRKRKSSVTSVEFYRSRTNLDKLDYLEQRYQRISMRFPQLKQTFEIYYLSMLLYLSKDSYITEEGIRRIKQMLKDFYTEKNHSRLPITLILRTKEVQYSSVSSLLAHKGTAVPADRIQTDYFD